MTQEDKDLLLKDLCGRLPYGIKVQIDFGENCLDYDIPRYVDDTVICIYPNEYEVGVYDEDQACDIDDIKLYLRPMSSMTKKEKKEFLKLADGDDDDFEDIVNYPNVFGLTVSIETFDWLNSHHLDYRGLIEKDLALEAAKDMYK